VRFFFEPSNESARPTQCPSIVINAEEQKETVAGCTILRTHQGRMVVDSPFVKTEQHRSIGVEELTKVTVPWRCGSLAE
jgi:hypothetical protein